MEMSTLVHSSEGVVQMGATTDMGVFKYFPQPVYLLDENMLLIEKNIEAQYAMERHWVGVIAGKLHFNNVKNTLHVKQLIRMMKVSDKCVFERFVLPCIDGVYRAYTLSKHNAVHSEFLLTIQDDVISDEKRIAALARAFSLTPSETNVLSYMVMGNKPKEIAYETGVSLCTVRSHLRTLYAKMNVRNYNDALKEAIRLLV